MAKQAVVTNYTIFNDRIRSDIRIALVTDLHERRCLDIVNILKEQQPDIIAVAGDTLERYEAEKFKPNIRKRKNGGQTDGFFDSYGTFRRGKIAGS